MKKDYNDCSFVFLVPLVVGELDHKGEAVVLHVQVGQYANLGALGVE